MATRRGGGRRRRRRDKGPDEDQQRLGIEDDGGGVAVITDRDFTTEMETAYLEYSMSVIVARALPDVRDGLKPVQRRILWGMFDTGMRADGPHRKSAKVVGEVMGSYHPHGDQSIYEALVRMGQPFNMYVPLVDAQGNFGSPGFPPAAMRYTECRPSPTAEYVLRDIREDTVDFIPTYDGASEEPEVLPGLFPNLLVNGASGIAVGMATNIPSHNPLEVINAALLVLDNPGAGVKRIMGKLRGPDFPSGCDVIGHEGIVEALESGSGRFTVRARVQVEPSARGASRIAFTNLPPSVSVSQVAGQIVAQMKDRGRLQSISRVEDASDKTGQELHVFTKKGHAPEATVAELLRLTKLEDSFSVNMRALVDGIPRVLGVRDVLLEICAHRMEVVLRRSRHRRAKAQERRHIVLALLRALDMIDEVIATIRSSQDTSEARERLMALLDVDERQAQAILEMQLRKLVNLEQDALREELAELEALISALSAIIDDEDVRRGVVRDELRELRNAYKNEERRSEILDVGDEAYTDEFAEDAVQEAAQHAAVPVQVRVLRGGWIEVTPSEGRRRSWKGGDPGRAPLFDEDVLSSGRVGVLTDDGRAYTIPLPDVPEGQRVLLSDVCGAARAARAILAFPVGGEDAPGEQEAGTAGVATATVLLATASGKVKRLPLADTVAARRDGLAVVRLDDGDRVVSAGMVADDSPVALVSSDGHGTRLLAGDVPVQGRASAGVKGMRLDGDAVLVAGVPATDDDVLFFGTAKGWVKGVRANELPVKGRGVKGLAVHKPTSAKGDVAAAVVTAVNATIYVVDDARKAHETKVTAASRSGQGRHLTDGIAAVFAPIGSLPGASHGGRETEPV